jgi:hypothetical protein
MLKHDPKYAEFEYDIYVSDGAKETMKGLYNLCDGGYHKWLTTISGYKHPEDYTMKAWSKLCESTKKDVECVFGILKKRFRILTCPCLENEPANLDRTMQTCVILHNMVMQESGLANLGTEARQWRNVDIADARRTFGMDLNLLDTLLVSRHGIHDEVTQEADGFEEKCRSLVKHYAIVVAAGEVERMRTVG